MTVTAYNPLPIAFTHGAGIWLYDKDQQAYLDALCGIAVTGLGHNHPAITQTIKTQAAKLLHTSNIYQITQQQLLAEKLQAITGMEQAFFANSGAEANEAALKLARLYGHQQGIETPEIIVMENAFHGRTLATLSASGNKKIQAGYEPLVPGFIRAPFNNIPALEALAKTHKNIVAILVEPIQGEGGIITPANTYLIELRKLCDKHNWLLILDEVQTGNGRTGKYYAYQHYPIKPDVLTTAKGLGNGIPISACLMHGPATNLFQPNNHGSTFGGNPFACAVALTVLNTINLEHINHISQQLHQALEKSIKPLPLVKSIRGQGLMIGIELTESSRELLKIGLKHNILFNLTGEHILRLLPPLILQPDDVGVLVERLALCLSEFKAN